MNTPIKNILNSYGLQTSFNSSSKKHPPEFEMSKPVQIFVKHCLFLIEITLIRQ